MQMMLGASSFFICQCLSWLVDSGVWLCVGDSEPGDAIELLPASVALGKLGERPDNVGVVLLAGVQEERLALLVTFASVDRDVFDREIAPVYQHAIPIQGDERFGLDRWVGDAKPHQVAMTCFGQIADSREVLFVRV